MNKEVLVIFKTHLDIGYTDYAENVIRKYIENYIPNAIKIGYELKDTDTPFAWNVGSWIIWKALQEDKDGVVEQAIKDGILNWHALPYTSHTELMSPELFEYGLNISKKLDERFNRKTIGAKMTDVPGHTIGMVPLMQKYGVEFLHIGINEASSPAPVPEVFQWKNGNSSIYVMYSLAYGGIMEFDDFVVYFAHTNDNLGPQSAQEVVDVYAEAARRFPGCRLVPATIDSIAHRVSKMKHLPVIEKEIGDTWIHGAATDPQKLSRYKNALRFFDENKAGDYDISDNLFLIPEHTWGMCVQVYFNTTDYYTHRELEKCPAEMKFVIEKSWLEQREYVSRVEKLFGIQSAYPVSLPDLSDYTKTEIPDGIAYEVSWQLFDNSDFERYKKEYLRLTPQNEEWALWDNVKVGLPDYTGGIYLPHITEAYEKDENKLYKLEFDEELIEKYGLPYFYMSVCNENVEISWFGKKDSRLPQAFWFKMKGFNEDWELDKLGCWIKPENIIGSPLISAVNKGIRNSEIEIDMLDSALVAPYGRNLLRYNLQESEQDLYFNLYNNIWNTNFRLWYSDDSIFRFRIKRRNKNEKR